MEEDSPTSVQHLEKFWETLKPDKDQMSLKTINDQFNKFAVEITPTEVTCVPLNSILGSSGVDCMVIS